jgi:uncharacterized protein YgiM (DUF1202 family)
MKVRALALLAAAVSTLSAQVPETRPESRPATPAESFPFMARVVRNDVNVRGGASEAYSPLARLKTGAVVRVTGRAGDWYRVEVPGGLPVWTAQRAGSKEYVKEEAPGLGVVVARDLQVRGTPNTNEPSLGEFAVGDRLEIVERKDEWIKVLRSSAHAGYLAARMVKAAPDAAAATQEFADAETKARETMIAKSSELEATLKTRSEQDARKKKLDLALERYVVERRKPAGERDLREVRAALEAVVAEGPSSDDPAVAKATATLEDIKAIETLEDRLRRAKESHAETERRAKEARETYDREYEALKRRKEEDAARRERAEKKYVAVGFVRLAPPIPGALDKAPDYALHRGSQREYYLVSDKYALGDFNGKHVGVLEAEAPEVRPGLPIRVLKVLKLEIIAPGAE